LQARLEKDELQIHREAKQPLLAELQTKDEIIEKLRVRETEIMTTI
jgi:hypothetical protein